MRDPKAADSPFQNEYQQWDYWMYANARDSTSEETQQLFASGLPDGWLWLSAGVDKQGHLVPYAQYEREKLEIDAGTRQRTDSGCSFSIWSAGPMDQALQQRFLAEHAAIRAEFAPPVPDWLASAPPSWACLLPDGRVATLGEPGSGTDAAAYSALDRPQSGGDTHWHLYSADGALLKEGEPGGEWWHLCFENYQQVLGVDGDKVVAYEYNGLINVYDTNGWESKGTYMYDGTPVADIMAAYQSGSSQLCNMSAAEIPLIHKAQHKR